MKSHDGSHKSKAEKSGKDDSVPSIKVKHDQEACKKPFEFIRDPPTSGSPYDLSVIKLYLPKHEKRKWEKLTDEEMFSLFIKYMEVLKSIINIRDEVQLIDNHGAPVWNDRGLDTCIPWRANMPSPFTMYNHEGKKLTSSIMPKESYEDRASILAHWYLFHTLKDHYRAWCQLTTTDAYGNTVKCDANETKSSDCIKHYKRQGFDMQKASNLYVYIQSWCYQMGKHQNKVAQAYSHREE